MIRTTVTRSLSRGAIVAVAALALAGCHNSGNSSSTDMNSSDNMLTPADEGTDNMGAMTGNEMGVGDMNSTAGTDMTGTAGAGMNGAGAGDMANGSAGMNGTGAGSGNMSGTAMGNTASSMSGTSSMAGSTAGTPTRPSHAGAPQ